MTIKVSLSKVKLSLCDENKYSSMKFIWVLSEQKNLSIVKSRHFDLKECSKIHLSLIQIKG
jgi:hypothetical protein